MNTSTLNHQLYVHDGVRIAVMWPVATQLLCGSEMNEIIESLDVECLAVLASPSEIKTIFSNAVKVMARAKTVGLVVIRGSTTRLFCTKEAWNSVGKFDPNFSGDQIISEFKERSKLARRFPLIDITIPEPSEAETISFAKVSNDRTFRALETAFALISPQTQIIEISCMPSNDSELMQKVQLAIDYINKEENSQALSIIKPITAQRRDITELYWVQAVAEAKLSLFKDAARSLMLLLEVAPQHAEGRKLLDDITNARLCG